MYINSFNFIIIYPFLFLLYYALPSRWTWLRNGYLLAVSYLLYLKFSPAFSLVLLWVTGLTYLAALLHERKPNIHLISGLQMFTGGGRRLLVLSLLLTALPLFCFKYYDFLISQLSALFGSIGLQLSLPGLNWAVPVGLSFFTFQAIAYLADVWAGRIEAEHNFLNYALFLSFFPSIVSGPINRAKDLLPQIRSLRPAFDSGKVVAGLKLLLWGVFMKVVVADRIGLYVDVAFGRYTGCSGLCLILTSVLYAIQIYADFAGYSLMAIGVGKTFGLDLAENFRRPYFSVSVTDFWRRWHISLSTWLRDYIYIPLGGSRCTKARNYLNIMLTFLVSGIWHGANWTFILWGLWHGLSQVIEKALGQQKCEYGRFGRIVKILITFIIVDLGWVLFRMPSVGDALDVIRRMLTLSSGNFLADEIVRLFFIVCGVMVLFTKDICDEVCPGRIALFENKRRIVRWISYLLVIVAIMLTGVFDTGQFIYANF